MKRRKFIKSSSLQVLSISAFGTLNWNGKSFEGNNPTTTDILGPFYRPGAPERTNLILPSSKGTPLIFKGTIYREDGKTPLDNALVEIWHCDENQVYDNTSDDYNYRAGQKTSHGGEYEFKTILPVPYLAVPGDDNSWRPAHIHMRVSVPNQQDLITQIYFSGDKYNATDRWASDPQAINRVLKISRNDKNENVVVFDVILSKEIPVDKKVFDRISGLFDVGNDNFVEFYGEDDLLFMKRNGQLIASLRYTGNNTFEGGLGNPKVIFELLSDGGTKAIIQTPGKTINGMKFLKYG